MLGLLLMGFATFGFLVFGNDVAGFYSPLAAIQTLFQFMIGESCAYLSVGVPAVDTMHWRQHPFYSSPLLFFLPLFYIPS